METKKVKHSLEEHAMPIRTIAFSPDSQRLLTGDELMIKEQYKKRYQHLIYYNKLIKQNYLIRTCHNYTYQVTKLIKKNLLKYKSLSTQIFRNVIVLVNFLFIFCCSRLWWRAYKAVGCVEWNLGWNYVWSHQLGSLSSIQSWWGAFCEQ